MSRAGAPPPASAWCNAGARGYRFERGRGPWQTLGGWLVAAGWGGAVCLRLVRHWGARLPLGTR
eukprot:7730889-Lingulodinium_polyedra.AAC.1